MKNTFNFYIFLHHSWKTEWIIDIYVKSKLDERFALNYTLNISLFFFFTYCKCAFWSENFSTFKFEINAYTFILLLKSIKFNLCILLFFFLSSYSHVSPCVIRKNNREIRKQEEAKYKSSVVTRLLNYNP